MADEPQQPLNPDLMGYPTVEALVAAKRASDQEAIRLKERANRADELERLITAQSVANPRQDVPDRSKPGWYQRLETIGIPPEDIMEGIRDVARGMVHEELQPVFKMGTARNQMVGKYQDYAKFEADIGAFINSDPKIQETYSRVFNADPVAAFEWAYHEFGASRRRNGAPAPPPKDDGATHAAIPSQRAGDARSKAFSAEVGLEEAARAYRENPSRMTAERYAKERLRTVITDEHLFGGNQ